MKVLLIQPNCAEEVDKDFLSLQYPINLGYVASALENASHEVKMLDFNVMERKKLAYRDIALLSGLTSILLAIAPFIGLQKVIGEINGIILALLFGGMGVLMPIIQPREYKNMATKAALVCSITGIVIAAIEGIVIFVR